MESTSIRFYADVGQEPDSVSSFAFLLHDGDTWYSWKPGGLSAVTAYELPSRYTCWYVQFIAFKSIPAPSRYTMQSYSKTIPYVTCYRLREKTIRVVFLITLYFSVFNFILSFRLCLKHILPDVTKLLTHFFYGCNKTRSNDQCLDINHQQHLQKISRLFPLKVVCPDITFT